MTNKENTSSDRQLVEKGMQKVKVAVTPAEITPSNPPAPPQPSKK